MRTLRRPGAAHAEARPQQALRRVRRQTTGAPAGRGRAPREGAASAVAPSGPPAPSPRRDPQPAVRLQSQWTGGPALATRAASLLLWAALLTGPGGLLLAVAALAAHPAALAVPAPVADRSGQRAAVQEFAQRFVDTWLQTPRGQEDQLQAYVRSADLSLPEVPWTVQQSTTADVADLGAGSWSVTVSALVQAPSSTNRQPAPAAYRYFQVPVRYAGGAVVAQALPSPVPAPRAASPAQMVYRYPQDPTAPAPTAVQGFLAAQLTGSGDVARYTSPGATVAAITPAPYSAVQVTDVLADRDLAGASAAPTEGEQLRVLVTAAATASLQQVISVQYALTLRVRAGRWEVASLDRMPALAAPAASSTPTPGHGAPAGAGAP